MKDENTEAARKLQKLGHHLREGLTARRNAKDKQAMEAIHRVVQEQFEKQERSREAMNTENPSRSSSRRKK
jgi:hypothetical protein